MTHWRKGAMMSTLGEKPETAGSDDVSGEEGAGEMMSYADTTGWKIFPGTLYCNKVLKQSTKVVHPQILKGINIIYL